MARHAVPWMQRPKPYRPTYLHPVSSKHPYKTLVLLPSGPGTVRYHISHKGQGINVRKSQQTLKFQTPPKLLHPAIDGFTVTGSAYLPDKALPI